jgi:hypothetical protein
MPDQPELVVGGDASDAVRELAKLEQQFQRLRQANEKLRRATKRTAKAREDTFGSRALAQVKSYAIGIAGITGALALARRASQLLNESIRRGQAGMRRGEQPLAQLLQVQTTGRPFALLEREVRATRAQVGMLTEPAARFQFALESAQLGRERAWIAGMHPAVDPTAMAEAVGAVTAGFGRARAGPPRQIVNKLLAAAAMSPLTAGRMAEAIGPLGESFRLIGGRPQEAFAAIGIAARGAGGEKGAMAMARLADFLAGQERFEGLGFFGGVRALLAETAGMTPAQRLKHIPEKRAVRGLGIFEVNRELIRTVAGDIERRGAQAPGADAVSRFIRQMAEEPSIAVPRARRIAGEQRLLAEETSARAIAQERADMAEDWILSAGPITGIGAIDVPLDLLVRGGIGAARTLLPKTLEPWALGADKIEKIIERGARRGTGGPELGPPGGEPGDRVGD